MGGSQKSAGPAPARPGPALRQACRVTETLMSPSPPKAPVGLLGSELPPALKNTVTTGKGTQ